MTEGQARRILRKAESIGLKTGYPDTPAGRTDASMWQTLSLPRTWCVSFWKEPLENCTAFPDAALRIEYEAKKPGAEILDTTITSVL